MRVIGRRTPGRKGSPPRDWGGASWRFKIAGSPLGKRKAADPAASKPTPVLTFYIYSLRKIYETKLEVIAFYTHFN